MKPHHCCRRPEDQDEHNYLYAIPGSALLAGAAAGHLAGDFLRDTSLMTILNHQIQGIVVHLCEILCLLVEQPPKVLFMDVETVLGSIWAIGMSQAARMELTDRQQD